MIEDRQSSSIMKQGIPHLPGGRSDITRAMHPVRILFGGSRRSNVKVDVAGIGMIDDTPVEKAWALVRPDDRLRMDPGVNSGKVIDPVSQESLHLF